MKAVEVFINGHRVCLAGVGEGVLSAIVNVFNDAGGENDYLLSIGGLDTRTDEHVDWDVPSVGVGSEVLVRLIDVPVVDPPSERSRPEPQVSAEMCRQVVRRWTAKLTPAERQQLLQDVIAELGSHGA